MNKFSFSELKLSEPIMRVLASERFETPTPIQQEAIPVVLAGRDVLASAQTGSGKTAAFALPILQMLSSARPGPGRRGPRALVLAPTRELAGQIAEVFEIFCRNLKVSIAVIFGGVGKSGQINAMRRGVDVVVATPGRLLDLMGEGIVSLADVQVIVLDEADRMLDMGFIPDVERIIKKLPSQRQSLFFSATLPPEVVRLADKMLKSPVRIAVESSEKNTPKIDQKIMFVTREEKREALRLFLNDSGSYRALVFTRTKHRAKDLSRYLTKNGIPSDDLQGNKSQNARTRALADFHSGKIQVLVATDIASRGIDVEDIDHVINFELPNEPESYVHRIGRTARAGKSGTALSLCDESEIDNLRAIQKSLAGPIPVMADHAHHAPRIAEAAVRPQGGGRNGAKGASSQGRGKPSGGEYRRSGRQNGFGRGGHGHASGGRDTGSGVRSNGSGVQGITRGGSQSRGR
ncbi:MAG TPA: DEAD/DEAH box helicase [Spirochaetia bacterium]|nr:DEAD/DEAH box helicase [Spirochaetia bacterium]